VSSLSSRRAPRQTCQGRGANLRPPAPQASTLPKELSIDRLIADYSEPLEYLENADVENGHGEEGEDVEQDDGAHCRTLQQQ
jgi:hypothetical protein